MCPISRQPHSSRASPHARTGLGSVVAVPLLRSGRPIGAIGVSHRMASGLTAEAIALVRTFADQAVIAIENARLLTELRESNRDLGTALTRQTATSEILRVIAGSPADLQPVLDALVESAARLCEAAHTFLLLVEGEQLKVAACHGDADVPVGFANPIHRGWLAGRAAIEARMVHVEDLTAAQVEFPLGHAIAVRFGHRTALAMPLLREGAPIGVLFLRRREVRRFSDKEIALIQTFADQAVIAIENVRLFTELEARNRDAAEALDQQTATGEILRVISQSPTDLQPVFDAIAASAARLCSADRRRDLPGRRRCAAPGRPRGLGLPRCPVGEFTAPPGARLPRRARDARPADDPDHAITRPRGRVPRGDRYRALGTAPARRSVSRCCARRRRSD